MAKTRTAFFCKECGYESPKWLGKCPSCSNWNSFIEEVLQSGSATTSLWKETGNGTRSINSPVKLSEVIQDKEIRLKTNQPEFDRVLGGGIVAGSLILIGGEPGVGKSTIMLQLASSLKNTRVLYISGEESNQQLKMRADRLGYSGDNIFILPENSTERIFQQVKSLKPQLVIVDSIQTLSSQKIDGPPGSISQVKQCAGEMLQFAKETNTPVFLIGHITKDGSIAGPKMLEHMVDTVLYFEGDRNLAYRILRTIKNRFGSTSEIGIYEMQNAGLREVSNPSEILISNMDHNLSGITIGASLEGNRPLLIEIQSLVSQAAYGTPQRVTNGVDSKRLNLLIAVVEKRGGLKIGSQDIFLNVAGGLKVNDPALDLAIAVALASSHQEIPLPDHICFSAEIGLGGEIRAVNRIEERISEAEKLGFKEIFLSKFGPKKLKMESRKIEIKQFGKLSEIFSTLFK